MKTHITGRIMGTLLVVMTSVSGFASAVDFRFDVPVMPSPPQIASVTDSMVDINNSVFTVFADIQGQTQKEICCNGVCAHECEPNCDFSACGITDFGGVTDPRVIPNPPCIPGSVDSTSGAAPAICGGKSGNPKVYYYYNGDITTLSSSNMSYDPIAQRFKAPIPINLYGEGDFVNYYIVAADNMGNVVSEVPDPLLAPCGSATSWDSGYDTSPVANCSVSNGYEQCGKFKSGTPSCGAELTVNDPVGDTCGEAGTLSANSKVDIVGMTVGYGKGFSELPMDNVVCAKVKLAANPPDVGEASNPMEIYILTLYNPDIVDPNPNDYYIPNASVITYVPGVNGADPYLVKVLWDGECVTNPNTVDPFSCKIINGGSNESKLKITSGNGYLTFIAKDSIPGKTLVGGTSKSASIVMSTGELQLDGGTPFWQTDRSSGMSMIAKNHSAIFIIDPNEIAPPMVPSAQTCINGAGTAFPAGTCARSASQPASNKCRLTINPSPDPANKYTIYHSVSNSASTATKLVDITTNLTAQNVYDHTITTLDGKTHYYFFSATKNGWETPQRDWSASSCAVEDWTPSGNPAITSCVTPPGKKGVCECKWEIDTTSDPSITGFRVLRNNALIANETKLPAAPGARNYSFTDPSGLVLGEPYLYKIQTVDAGGNVSSGALAYCSAEDFAAPSKIDSVSASAIQGATIGMKIVWNGELEADIAGYNVYKCDNNNQGCDQFPSVNWNKINSDLVPYNGSVLHSVTDLDVRDGGSGDIQYCFWVEACDNCDSIGSCPSTNEPNCSPFSTMEPYRLCPRVIIDYDILAPATPTNVVVASPSQNGTCALSWSPVTTHSNGAPFDDPFKPTSLELTSYYIMRAPLGETVPNNPNTAPSQNIVGIAGVSTSPIFIDRGMAPGITYQYLVIAYDGAQNYSAPQGSPVTCIPAEPPVLPVDTVSLTVGEGNTSCDISWEAVSDPEIVTYSAHRCDKPAISCVKANTMDFPTGWGSELGLPIVGIMPPLELSDTTVDLENYTYTYCITVTDPSGNESPIFEGASAAGSPNCVQCEKQIPPDPCDVAVPPAGCNISIKVGKITERKIMACTLAMDPTGCKSDAYKIVEAAPAGATVKIVDAATGETVKTVVPAADGTVADIKVDPAKTPWYVAGHQYKAVVDIPADKYGGLIGACENSATVATDGKCSVAMTTEPKTLLKVRNVTGEAQGSVFVGYGGDIGDVTGDGKVNINDMMDIKFAYGKTKASGSQCYKTWADANLDGAVTVADMMIIKKYYNKTMVVPKANGETITPTLLQSADPMPACCKTSPPTCQ